MATKTWNGSNASFNTAADWSPTGVPMAGDTAVINSGTVALSSALSNVAIQLNEIAGATAATTLSLTNVTLDASSPLTVTNNQPSLTAAAPVIAVNGAVTLAGTETFNSSSVQFTIAANSTLANAGALVFNASSPVTSGAGTLANNGTISLNNPSGVAVVPVFGTAIGGTGQIVLNTNARIEFDSSVSNGQTLAFNGGASGNETAQFNAVGSFGGTVSGFSASDLLAVVNTPYTGATYSRTGADSGTLRLYSGTALQGSMNFTGNYVISSFTFKYNNFGGGQSNLQITTSGSGTSGTGTGAGTGDGTSTAAGPVYRFFDTRFGTHFFTSDVGERNTVISTRADLVQEVNGFGDVAPTDTSAVAVYRFFDTKFGTHFFTANSGERDTVIATRPDLTYEVNSTFYEHSAQQGAGDTAVYRLFDTGTGTQFLTGDQTEYNGLTTAGSGTYRPDLRSEGVAFYAPVGQFS